MFGKKFQCPRCGEKVDKSFSYCPRCGSQLRAEEKQEQKREPKQPDNLLDALDSSDFKMPFMLRLPFKKLVREIEQQFREMDKTISEEKERKKTKPFQLQPSNFSQGISISIASSGTGQPVIRVKRVGPGMPNMPGMPGRPMKIKEEQRPKQNTPQNTLKKKLTKAEKEKLKKFAALPRQEPETTVRRLTDRIIYEILLPGIKDKRNIIINKLQNSIEIKAFTKDKAYFKLIPLGLPIKRQYLEKEKLILELKPQI